MAYKSVYNGVIFIEGNESYEQKLGFVEYKKGFGVYDNQLKNLDDVKRQLADKAKSLGGNCIINFKYGQKNTSWFRSILLALDDNINWYGTGEAVCISKEKYNEIINELNNK